MKKCKKILTCLGTIFVFMFLGAIVFLIGSASFLCTNWAINGEKVVQTKELSPYELDCFQISSSKAPVVLRLIDVNSFSLETKTGDKKNYYSITKTDDVYEIQIECQSNTKYHSNSRKAIISSSQPFIIKSYNMFELITCWFFFLLFTSIFVFYFISKINSLKKRS